MILGHVRFFMKLKQKNNNINFVERVQLKFIKVPKLRTVALILKWEAELYRKWRRRLRVYDSPIILQSLTFFTTFSKNLHNFQLVMILSGVSLPQF